MGLVRAKKDVFLGEHGYHSEGDEFNYTGPDNENLEAVEPGPYTDYGEDELRTEINRRGGTYPSNATNKELQALLEVDDAKPGAGKLKPKRTRAKPGAAKAEAEAANLDGSGSEKYGASDWTAAGFDTEGYPVEKGSDADVS